MTRKKVEANHNISEPDLVENSALDATEETESIYEPDMAPLEKAEEQAVDETEKTIKPQNASDLEEKIMLALVGGATFSSGGRVYKKGVLEPVPPDVAKRLLKTGFFERS